MLTCKLDLQTISLKRMVISRKGCQASKWLYWGFVQPKCYRCPRAQITSSGRQWSSDQWGFVKLLHDKNWDCLWVSFHKNGEAFTSGWGTITHSAREVGLKAERWREYQRITVGLANGLGLNGALLMGTECLRYPEASAECWEPQSR